MKKFTKLTSLCLVLFFVLSTSMNKSNAQNVAKLTTNANGDSVLFLQHLPAGHTPGSTKKYPVIIFLHGGGEKSDNTSLAIGKPIWTLEKFGPSSVVKRKGTMTMTWNNQIDSFIVLSPMMRKTARGSTTEYKLWAMQFITPIIAHAKTLHIDTNRIYMTGLSMGGGGTMGYISYLASAPKNLAAAAAICPASQFYANGPQYVSEAKLPVWAFHATDDGSTFASQTIAAIDAINNRNPAPQVKALKTIYPAGTFTDPHRIWDQQYNIDNSLYRYGYDGIVNIYEWFLGQAKNLPVNVLPTANAGADFSVAKSPGLAKLSGTLSSDDGVIRRYVWKKISAPPGVNPSTITIDKALGPDSTTTARNLTTPGAYTFRLYVVDNRAATDFDDVTITVTNTTGNQPPTAGAGQDKTLTLPTDSVRVYGTYNDPEGASVSLKWEYVSGPSGSTFHPNSAAQNPIIKNLVQGDYQFHFKVTDAASAVDYDTVKITVLAANNTPPVAGAGSDKTITLPVDSIRLYGSAEDMNAGGSVVETKWEYVNGPDGYYIYPNPYALNPIMKNLSAGVYHFQIKVTDNDGAYSYDTVKITVNPGTNQPPVAYADEDVFLNLPEDSVRIYGRAEDPDGEIAEYKWEYVSGPTGSQIFPNPYALYPIMKDLVVGVYQFRIKVTDDDGAIAYDTVQITVAGNLPPIAGAGPDKTLTLPVDSVRVYGSRSDPDGPVPSSIWELVSGPSGSTIYPNAYALNPIFKDLQAGIYYYRIKVTDSDNAVTYDTVKITVNSGGNAVLAESSDDEANQINLNLTVHPNPVSDVLNVTLNSGEMGRTIIGIYDATGTLRKSEQTWKATKVFRRSINISELTAGVYYVHIMVDGKRHLARFIR